MSNQVLIGASETARSASGFGSEERYRFLSRILESFTGTVELKEVLRRIVTMTREEFGADRGWLLHPISAQAEVAKIRFIVSAPDEVGENKSSAPCLSLKHSSKLIQRLLDADGPIVVMEDDPDLDREQAAILGVRSEIVQVLRPRDDEPWAFGLHQVSTARQWTDEEISLFAEAGRYATLALDNTLLHERAARELAKVNAILGQISESVVILDAGGRIERLNAAAQHESASLFAPDPESRVRRNHPRHLDGSPLDANDLPSMRAIRGEVVKSEYVVQDARSGDDRVVSVSAAPIRDERDHIIGSIVLSRDVTEERRIAEREAGEVDARLRFEAVLESAPIGVAVFSADELCFELANARFVDFVRQLGKIAVATPLVGLRVDKVIPSLEKVLRQVADSGEMSLDEELKVDTEPTPMYVNRIVSAVRGRLSGITQNLTVLIQDVTDQVNARREIEDLAQAMAERSARLDSILSSMTDGLWVYDAGGQVVSVNEAAITMFGFGSRTEAAEHGSFSQLNLRYPDGRPIPDDDLPHARALRGATVPDYLAVGRHFITGKDLDLSIAAAPIESNGIVGAVLVIRDITALQELDRKKDEFLSVASHELRTPLTTIKGYTQLLTQTINNLPPEERMTYLHAILGEVDRMMGLISELLDVSRIQTKRLQIDRQPVGWLEFLDRRASAFRVLNPVRTIRFSRADILETTLLVDPDRMRQVVDNLISNAIKYSGDESDIELFVKIDADHLVTVVSDHGIGIPADEIPRLFERFHRARNVSSRYYGGLGLGLYIAKAIVEAHNGSISVFSEEGRGASFTIRLPLL